MLIYQKELKFDNHCISYTLHIKKIKNIILKVNHKGEVIVSSNPYVSQRAIDTFLKQKINWILNMQAKHSLKKTIIYDPRLTPTEFYLFGNKLNIIYQSGVKNDVTIVDNTLYLYFKGKKDNYFNVMNQFIKETCYREFDEIIQQCYEIFKAYGVQYPIISYRKMTSRWGSCIPSKHKITLNMNLIHYPKAFGEYVILHEFAHFLVPNHSKAFYQIIQAYMPDYKERINIAK